MIMTFSLLDSLESLGMIMTPPDTATQSLTEQWTKIRLMIGFKMESFIANVSEVLLAHYPF